MAFIQVGSSEFPFSDSNGINIISSVQGHITTPQIQTYFVEILHIVLSKILWFTIHIIKR
jgi:hypothetical protein